MSETVYETHRIHFSDGIAEIAVEDHGISVNFWDADYKTVLFSLDGSNFEDLIAKYEAMAGEQAA